MEEKDTRETESEETETQTEEKEIESADEVEKVDHESIVEEAPESEPLEEPNVFPEEEEIFQDVTTLDTPAGPLTVVHDITIGDLLISTILMAFLIFHVINALVRRF